MLLRRLLKICVPANKFAAIIEELIRSKRRWRPMNIQIFGTKKCNDTKKAERFFKERGIKYQFIDMKEKGMSKGEFMSVAQPTAVSKIW